MKTKLDKVPNFYSYSKITHGKHSTFSLQKFGPMDKITLSYGGGALTHTEIFLKCLKITLDFFDLKGYICQYDD